MSTSRESESYAGRVVVVTGGAGALGRAACEALLAAGAEVHVPLLEDAIPEGLGFAAEPRAHLAVGVDLSQEAAAVAYFEDLPRPWATLNVAGGFAMAPVAETRAADFQRMWTLNTLTCFLACRESVRRMRGSPGGGRIVNVAARPALVPTAGMVAYSAAKAGVAALTLALAEEVADEEIWVNALAPSIIDTPANRAAMPDADHERWPSTQALARAMLDLASPSNQCMRGAIVPVYGRS